jgi:acyl-CoA synthetase (NDP forming)
MERRRTRARWMTASASPRLLPLAIRIDLDEAELLEFLGRDPETKVVASSALMPEVSDAIIAATEQTRKRGSQKPIHVCWVAPRAAAANREKLQAAEVPCHAWPAATAAVLAATFSRRHRPPARLPAREPIPQPATVDHAGWLTSAAALCLLQQAGFPVARWAVVTDPAAAAAAAAKLQFPVVLKAERPTLTHKSDAGAVRLGLTDGAAVAEAFENFSRR